MLEQGAGYSWSLFKVLGQGEVYSEDWQLPGLHFRVMDKIEVSKRMNTFKFYIHAAGKKKEEVTKRIGTSLAFITGHRNKGGI